MTTPFLLWIARLEIEKKQRDNITMNMPLGQEYLKEFDAEVTATRKCIERVPESLYTWKPHEKSMVMGYLVLLVAEMPRWMTVGITDGDINFGTFKHEEPKTTEAMVAHFDKNVADLRALLSKVSDETLAETFTLRSGDNVLMETTKQELITSTLNHWVHHRGQLTVYLRLNDLPVPSIYGPSGDEQSFS